MAHEVYVEAGREAGIADAHEVAPEAECIPGRYEMGNLTPAEYGGSKARGAFGDMIADASRAQRHDAERAYFYAFIRELASLRPDLRECGDEDADEENEGLEGLKGLGASIMRGLGFWR